MEESKFVGPRKFIFPNRQALRDWLYASTNVESGLVDAAALDECKKTVGDNVYEFDAINAVFIFRKSLN